MKGYDSGRSVFYGGSLGCNCSGVKCKSTMVYGALTYSMYGVRYVGMENGAQRCYCQKSWPVTQRAPALKSATDFQSQPRMSSSHLFLRASLTN
jgi:hypothetical protein